MGMENFHQTYLGATSAKFLTLVSGPPSAAPAEESSTTISSPQSVTPGPAKEAFILLLPDELLVEIIKLVAKNPELGSLVEYEEFSYSYRVRFWTYQHLKALSRVCHRFRQIAQPLLFRDISFEWPITTVPPDRLVRKLHRILKESSHFQQHCRSLQIYIPDSGMEDPPHKHLVASDFARCLTRIRYLSIHGGFENNQNRTHRASTWALIRRFVRYCSDIEHLRLSREGWGLYLADVFKWLDCPNLKTLSLRGISLSKHGRVELELEKRRTASFTSLIVSDFDDLPEAASLLIQWPTALSHFKFSSVYSNAYMDYPMLVSWLLIHRNTLKYVYIGYLSWSEGTRPFNATLFPNLEFLGLYRRQMHKGQGTIQFKADDANLLGPRLRTFCWDFSIPAEDGGGWLHFGEPESVWIRNLIKAAITSKNTLHTFKIQFSPDYWNTNESMGYPWDLMDCLRDDLLRPNGMDLVYNKPPISKEGWLKFVRTPQVFTDEDVIDSASIHQHDLVDDGEQSSEFSEQEGYEGEYQGEDIRKYFLSTSRI